MKSAIEVSRSASLAGIGPGTWNSLARACPDATAFQAYEWISAWWDTFGAGRESCLYVARVNDTIVGIAPLCRQDDTVTFIGHDYSDYNAFIARDNDRRIVRALLDSVLDDHTDAQVHLFDLPETGRLAQELGRRNNLRIRQAGVTPCPRLDRASESFRGIHGKKSVRRNRRRLARQGELQVRHLVDPDEIRPLLETLFSLHIDRWSGTDSPSLFLDENNRHFYRELLARGFPALLSVLQAGDETVAMHFGFVSGNDLVWYKPAFDMRYADCSPGEVLLAELANHVGENGLDGLDFTRGGEKFKYRFSSAERLNRHYIQYGSIPFLLHGRDLLKRLLCRR